MPAYDYHCDSCESTVEISHHITDETPRKCDECGADLVRLIGTGTYFVLKGSGWAKDGYR
jgi:putative FmdB family regulatory protein